MRILCLADLHSHPAGERGLLTHRLAGVLRRVGRVDLVLLAGDVFESPVLDAPPLPWRNPYGILAEWFPGVPVVFVLGNHECFGRSVAETVVEYRRMYDPGRWNVHCLDVVGSHEPAPGVLVVGNALWYDGSLAECPGQRLLDFAGGGWPDHAIRGFDPVVEHARCVDAIHEHLRGGMRTTILLTHTLPHRGLNRLPPGPFSAFSGCAGLLAEARFDWAVHGHTHLRHTGAEVEACRCVNPGSFGESSTAFAVIEA